MPAAEAAATLDTSVPAVNSALQRARATLASVDSEASGDSGAFGSSGGSGGSGGSGVIDAGLLDQYVDAFQRYDMSALVNLLHDDAVMSMPPYSFWVSGSSDIVSFMVEPKPLQCAGSVLVPVPSGTVNGAPAWAQYKPDPAGGHKPWALQVHEVRDGRFSRLTFFLDTERIFPEFGLPSRLG